MIPRDPTLDSSAQLLREGRVQGLDGDEHVARKALFMRLVSPSAVDELRALTDEEWRGAIPRWAREDPRRALGAIAHFLDPEGNQLSPRVAAVELLNVLRPTVAVARYVVFEAHALHLHPQYAPRVAGGDDRFLEAFAQEVRRLYPFFPSVVARVRRDFTWRGERFEKGTRVMLDLYGTNHDPRAWPDPYAFRPERFLERAPTPFELVPQGPGDAHHGHRCPGEGPTLALMKGALLQLTRGLHYAVPPQDLTIDLARIPAEAESRFVISDVRPAAPVPDLGERPAPS